MGRNRVSDDLDHVNDEPTATTKSKKPSSAVWPMPKFVFIKIKNGLQYGLGKLPSNISCRSYNIFSLFFTVDILQKLADYTNSYAAEWYSTHPKRAHDRKWIPTIVNELRAYIATYIYMGVHVESRMKDYWNTNDIKSLHLIVTKHIGLNR